MNNRDIAHICLVFLVGLSLCTVCHTDTPLVDRRIRAVRDSVIKINRELAKVESRENECNSTLYNVSEKLDKVIRKVKRLYKGPLLATVNIKQGFRDYDNVLLVLPDPVETCISNYKGTQVSSTQAALTCIQQIFWRYEPPVQRRKVQTEKRVVVGFASVIKDKIKKPPTTTPPIVHKPPPVHGTTLVYGEETPGSAFATRGQTTTTTTGPATGTRRVRKEYRSLSVAERARFHDAMNVLYKDGTIAAFAALHAAASEGAYKGPAFLPWHRVFITTFEDALQAVDPSVTLPYLDSTLDNCMEHPVYSILWTPGFLGNGAGQVDIGPFAHWVTDKGFLERTYGVNSRLISRQQVTDLMSRCNYKDIAEPMENGRITLESLSANVNAWVGGEMNGIQTAPSDPLFYLHHCYIDYLWEKFRQQQRSKCGVDPESDYIDISGPHSFKKPMDQINVIRNGEGLLNDWADIVEYVDSPTCDNNCGGSEVLYCNKSLACCVPVSKFDVPWDTTSSGTHANTDGKDEPPSQCEWYHDPECFYRRIAAMERTGKYTPLSATEELKIIENMMPRNRGKVFDTDADDSDGRSLLSASIAEEVEGSSG